jgi:hypothetical protein
LKDAKSASPNLRDREIMANDHDSDVDDEGLEMSMGCGTCERVGLEREDEIVNRVQDEVDKRYVMGHLQFRSWCPICVKAKGKNLDHKQDSGKERLRPECS